MRHGKGYASGSADLAECVLQRVRAPATAASSSSSSAITVRTAANATHLRSFFFASPHETRRREEVACARLGLEPPYGEFAQCVSRLDNNFYALDNPII